MALQSKEQGRKEQKKKEKGAKEKEEAKINYILQLLGRKRKPIEEVIHHEHEEQQSLNSVREEPINVTGDQDYEYLTEEIATAHNPLLSGASSQPTEFITSSYWQMSTETNNLPIKVNYTSLTTESQRLTSKEILKTYNETSDLAFYTLDHLAYIIDHLNEPMPGAYKSLDSNHSWMTYWLLNAYSLIKRGGASEGNEKEDKLEPETNKTSKAQQNDDTQFTITPTMLELINDKIERLILANGYGGIAGGCNQLGHAASTYSAILTLVLTQNYTLLNKLRPGIYSWILSLKRKHFIAPDKSASSFVMHEHGESDTRSTYCVLVIASLLGILTPELCAGVEDWILQCQTYQGGFAGVPGAEAHGGLTYCALGALFLLNSSPEKIREKMDQGQSGVGVGKGFDKLVKWCVDRQTDEGGFNGRLNKLVDACYGFWIGALFPMLDILRTSKSSSTLYSSLHNESTIFNREAMLNYMLRIAQITDGDGGFRDKPGKWPDFYHTNYSLCGVSLCQHQYYYDCYKDVNCDEKKSLNLSNNERDTPLAFKIRANPVDGSGKSTYPVHPVFGVPVSYINAACMYVEQGLGSVL